MLARSVHARMLGERFGEHAECSFFELWFVWFGHDVPIFLDERSELNPGQFNHRLARLQQEGSLFAFLDFDPPQERTTNPVESINSRIRALTYAHRGMTETHMQAMINWYLHSTTENPQSASHILREWNTAGRPQRRTIPKKKTKAKLKPTVGDMPVHYDTALTKEEGLWPRKGWAGRSH